MERSQPILEKSPPGEKDFDT
jgi:hypothetical protein